MGASQGWLQCGAQCNLMISLKSMRLSQRLYPLSWPIRSQWSLISWSTHNYLPCRLFLGRELPLGVALRNDKVCTLKNIVILTSLLLNHHLNRPWLERRIRIVRVLLGATSVLTPNLVSEVDLRLHRVWVYHCYSIRFFSNEGACIDMVVMLCSLSARRVELGN